MTLDSEVIVIGPSGISVVRRGYFRDVLTLSPPGSPKVTSITPAKTAYSRIVRIEGTGLSFATKVSFGTKRALFAETYPVGFLDSASTEVLAVVPRGLPFGKKVLVRVETAEARPCIPSTRCHPSTGTSPSRSGRRRRRRRPPPRKG